MDVDQLACVHDKTVIKLDPTGRTALELGREPCKAWSFGAGQPMWLCAHRRVCLHCGHVVAHSLGPECPSVPEWRGEGAEMEVQHLDVPRNGRG